jgi:hypothetical protein
MPFIIASLSLILGVIFQRVARLSGIPFLKEWYGGLSIIFLVFIISVGIYNLFLKKKHVA